MVVLWLVIEPKTDADRDKLRRGLPAMRAGDPDLQVSTDVICVWIFQLKLEATLSAIPGTGPASGKAWRIHIRPIARVLTIAGDTDIS